MRLVLARKLMVSVLALAFAVGGLMHAPLLGFAAPPPFDCHRMAGDVGHGGDNDHSSPASQSPMPGCPLANLAAYSLIPGKAKSPAFVRARLHPFPSPLLTSTKLDSADPPPRAGAA